MSQTWRDRLDTLDREVTPARAVVRWGGDPSTLRFASLRSNVVFRFESAGRGRYLRLVHARNRNRAEVEATVAFAAHLAAAGAPVGGPVRSLAGCWVEELDQAGELFVASVFREAPGTPLDRSCVDPVIFHAWGRALAELHHAAASFQPVDPAAFGTIRDQWERVRGRLADSDEDVRRAFAAVDAWMASLSSQSSQSGQEDWGLTHGDCNATNMLWDGSRIAVIDFDEPIFHWFPADLARPFREFPEDRGPERQRCQDAMVEGYRTVRPLSNEWVSGLPRLVGMIALDIYGWIRQLPVGTVLPGGETREDGLAELRQSLEAMFLEME